MNRSTRTAQHPRSGQPGNALIVVIVLLLLLSVVVFLGATVSVQEQRTSGNDLRAKLVHQIAEAAVAQGLEYFNLNRGELSVTNGNWERCTAADVNWPCGIADEDRRGDMYRYIGGTVDVDGSGSVSDFEEKLLPLPELIASTNGFDATYGVGALMCRVAFPDPANPTAPAECTTNSADASGTLALTLVAGADLEGDGARTSLSFSAGTFNVVSIPPDSPPVLASGTVSIGGGIQIVSNANSGGTGVPVSVWTRADMAKGGTPNTCYMDEFIRQGGTGGSVPGFYYGDGDWELGDVVVCDTCSCPSGASLSYSSSGNKQCEGMDVLDIEADPATGINDGCPDETPNYDVKRWEFPPDLFEYIFGIRAWTDTEQTTADAARTGDATAQSTCQADSQCSFGDTRIRNDDGVGKDTAFLEQAARRVIGDGENDEAECAALDVGDDAADTAATKLGSAGLIWIKDPAVCDITGMEQIGTPRHPVLLVHDGSLTQFHANVFGLMFVRAPDAVETLDPATGGPVQFGMNAGATIYGAVVVQGQVTSGGGGTAAIVFSSEVLANLNGDPTDDTFGSVPGSWTDQTRY